MIGRVAFALLLGGLVAPGVKAQAPPATMPPASVIPEPAQPLKAFDELTPPPPPVAPALPAGAANKKPEAAAAKKLKVQPVAAVNQRDPLTARGRFANPGGVGKYSEYYTPNTPMYGYPGLVNRHASFGNGGALTREEQIQTFQAGQYRTQNIQNNINTYGRPVGFGFGFGLGYGRGLGGFPR